MFNQERFITFFGVKFNFLLSLNILYQLDQTIFLIIETYLWRSRNKKFQFKRDFVIVWNIYWLFLDTVPSG